MQSDTNQTRAVRARRGETPLTHRPARLAAAAVAAASVLALGLGGPAAATPSSTLFLGAGGIGADDGSGGVLIEGPGLVGDKHLRGVLDATVRTTMSPVDGALPAIGECEPANARVVVDGPRDTDLTLVSAGTVCHVQHPIFTSWITVEFRGLHEVTQAKRPQLRGTSGSLSINGKPGVYSTVHADSFVPMS